MHNYSKGIKVDIVAKNKTRKSIEKSFEERLQRLQNDTVADSEKTIGNEIACEITDSPLNEKYLNYIDLSKDAEKASEIEKIEKEQSDFLWNDIKNHIGMLKKNKKSAKNKKKLIKSV